MESLEHFFRNPHHLAVQTVDEVTQLPNTKSAKESAPKPTDRDAMGLSDRLSLTCFTVWVVFLHLFRRRSDGLQGVLDILILTSHVSQERIRQSTSTLRVGTWILHDSPPVSSSQQHGHPWAGPVDLPGRPFHALDLWFAGRRSTL